MMSRDRLARIIQRYNDKDYVGASLMIRNTSKLGIAMLLMSESRDSIKPNDPERFRAFVIRILEDDDHA